MSDNLTARLRDFADPHDRYRATVDAVPHELLRKAADRIEALEAERDALREGIERAEPWLDYTHLAPDWPTAEEAVMRADAAFVRALLDPEDGETDE